ncbi:beta-N-acetylhexosaminidase [Bacillus mangrovi]|uniref:beta-N-acetylhexosaminidase n=1 Tax=Metabacillus mangrovi TaxID=1491830 RepID=A0A7X2S6U2_9BACI|nr:beta-N-acetylhexosaminidase [Metabacillus mangrovi]MTH54560.1 beta-N-acetylhexosaminidase [Metabacillus mangrovi]
MMNRKKSWIVFIVCLSAALLISLLVINQQSSSGDVPAEEHVKTEKVPADKNMPVSKETPAVDPSTPKSSGAENAKELLADMTIEEKVGQLMMVGFHGTEKNKNAAEFIENRKVGGIIYFDRNMSSPGQVAKLSNSLQLSAKSSGHTLPLMIAVDQEGGSVTRMKDQVSPLPSQQELGKIGSSQAVRETARINGRELKAMGINVNFAPVLDLSSTNSRSLGTDPEKTYQLSKEAVAGLNVSNITGALKHFPGHGRSKVDPHKDTSSVQAGQSELEGSDLYPFKEMIQNSPSSQYFVMVTHIKYPAYDQDKPASLSKPIITDLLRQKLGYNGIVVTDDMEMGAVNKYYSYSDMGVEAIKAGVDLLLVCHDYKNQTEMYDRLVKAVKTGEISEERIDKSVLRIISHKLAHTKPAQADPQEAEKVVGSKESSDAIEQYIKK